jgi:glucans biosynthesis protein
MKFFRLLVVAATCWAGAEAWGAEKFDFEILQFRAKTLAGKPYQPKKSKVPTWLEKYTYDQYRDIRFDPRHATWLGMKSSFNLQYFHPGSVFTHSVQINEVVDKEATRIDFSTKLFNYGANKTGRVPSDMGFAGFRVHYPLNSAEYYDELVS